MSAVSWRDMPRCSQDVAEEDGETLQGSGEGGADGDVSSEGRGTN